MTDIKDVRDSNPRLAGFGGVTWAGSIGKASVE